MKNKAAMNIYGMIVVLLGWTLLHITIQNASIPSPIATLINTVQIAPILLKHLGASLTRIAIALFFSATFGTALGLWMGMSKTLNRWLSPIIYILMPIPKVAFLPVFMILFGLGEMPKIIIVLSVIVFQFIVAAKDSIKEIQTELIYSVKTLGLSRIATFRHLLIPAILPQWFTALRVSFGVSIAVLFFGETFATTSGIGYYIMNRWGIVNYPDMFSGIVALSLFGLAVYELIDLCERKICKWLYL